MLLGHIAEDPILPTPGSDGKSAPSSGPTESRSTSLIGMKILFASAELAPFVRTGGLGNAVAGLAHAMSSDHDVTVAVPGYRDANAPGRKVTGRAWRRHQDRDIEVLFWLDESFDRPGVYGPDSSSSCLLYTSDAADDLTRVDLGGRRILKKK